MKKISIIIISCTLFSCTLFNTTTKRILPILKNNPDKISEQLSSSNSKIQDSSLIIESTSLENQITLNSMIKNDSLSKDLKDTTKNVLKNSKKITTETKKIKQTTLKNVKIQEDVSKLNIYLSNLKFNNKILNNKILKNSKKYKKLNKENLELKDKLKKDVQQRTKKIWMALIGFCAFLIVASVLTFMYVNKKAGMMGLVSSFIIIAIAQFMIKYAELAAIGGGVIILGGVGFFIYSFYIHRKALGESIISFEQIKNLDWDDPKVNTKKLIKSLQSPTTTDLIYKIRKKEKIGQ